MADSKATPLPTLFKSWRGGDTAAGEEMARRFSDWYYALAVSRLGEVEGREPLQRACDRFAQEIVTVTSPNMLLEWAHSVIRGELDAAGSRVEGGDFPNALTDRRSPKELVRAAWEGLPRDQLLLLAHAFDHSVSTEQVIQEAEAAGGFPVALLHARHALKRWLRDHQGIPFAIVPEMPELDCAPLPLYEAGRMGSHKEEARLERWLLSRHELCRDVAEFAVFAMAIRGGALGDPPPAPARAPEVPSPAAIAPTAAPDAAPAAAPATAPAARRNLALWGGTLVIIILLLATLAVLVLRD